MNQTQTNQTEVFARDAEGRPTQVIIGDKVVSAEYAKSVTDSGKAPSRHNVANETSVSVELWRYIMWLQGSDYSLLTPSEREHLAFWQSQLGL